MDSPLEEVQALAAEGRAEERPDPQACPDRGLRPAPAARGQGSFPESPTPPAWRPRLQLAVEALGGHMTLGLAFSCQSLQRGWGLLPASWFWERGAAHPLTMSQQDHVW